MENSVKKSEFPKEDVKRIRAIEGTIFFAVFSYVIFQVFIVLLKHSPRSDFITVFWGGAFIFVTFLFGLSLGFGLGYLTYLLQNFFYDFTSNKRFIKIVGYIVLSLFILAFIISLYVIAFSKPLEDAKNILEIIFYAVSIPLALITFILNKTKKNQKDSNPR